MKRKILLLLMIVTSVCVLAQQKSISYIKNDGSWYIVYDENGKKITAVSKMTVGKIIGWGTDFFVSVDGDWYKVYDKQGKKITTLNKLTVGVVISVSSNTFTSRDGSWIKTYNKYGKKLTAKPE